MKFAASCVVVAVVLASPVWAEEADGIDTAGQPSIYDGTPGAGALLKDRREMLLGGPGNGRTLVLMNGVRLADEPNAAAPERIRPPTALESCLVATGQLPPRRIEAAAPAKDIEATEPTESVEVAALPGIRGTTRRGAGDGVATINLRGLGSGGSLIRPIGCGGLSALPRDDNGQPAQPRGAAPE